MYVIDTSALLDGWARHYPPDVFPSLWSLIEEMIKVGELLSPDEVLVELSQKDDTVHRWAKANSAMFVPLDEDIQRATQEILDQFPRLVGAMKDRNRADPFVIALREGKGRDRCNWRKECRDSGPPQNSYRLQPFRY